MLKLCFIPHTAQALLASIGVVALALPGCTVSKVGEKTEAQVPDLGKSSVATRPNIVVILADDLGYGDLGCYNQQSKIPTPYLDRLAAQGLRCTDAHAPAAVCTPSRYGLLTGRYPWRPPAKGVLPAWHAPIIANDCLTVPKLLQQHGYATACFGKWHLGLHWPTKDGKPPKTGADRRSNVDFTKPIADGPTTCGFDYYFGVDVPNYPPYCFIENDHTVGIPSEPTDEFETVGPKLPGWNQEEILPELTRRAVRYLEDAAQAKKPFFVYFALTAPHHPLVPTAEFRGKSGAGVYGDFVMQTDWTVGQVLGALDRTGLADNTLVIFTSDNGPEITRQNVAGTKVVMAVGAYDRIQKYGHASMGPLRGTKYEAWEGGHRVPFIARWPDHIPTNSVSGHLLCLTDLLATCANLIGATLPPSEKADSVNTLPLLTSGSATRTSVVLAGTKGELAVRQGDWVWINAKAKSRHEPAWFRQQRGYIDDTYPSQLYSLSEDLSQRLNRYAEQPEKVHELTELLEEEKAKDHNASH